MLLLLAGSWGTLILVSYKDSGGHYNLNFIPLLGATTASFDVIPGPIHPFSFFSCTGDEAELLNCTHYTTSCSSRAGIKCLGIIVLLVYSAYYI